LNHTDNIMNTRTRVMDVFMPMSLLEDDSSRNHFGGSFESEA